MRTGSRHRWPARDSDTTRADPTARGLAAQLHVTHETSPIDYARDNLRRPGRPPGESRRNLLLSDMRTTGEVGCDAQ